MAEPYVVDRLDLDEKKVILSPSDGTTYTDTSYAAPFTAVAKNVVDGEVLTLGPRSIKARLDVNNANLAAGETVTLKIMPIVGR